jgi:hypothetical protein
VIGEQSHLSTFSVLLDSYASADGSLVEVISVWEDRDK